MVVFPVVLTKKPLLCWLECTPVNLSVRSLESAVKIVILRQVLAAVAVFEFRVRVVHAGVKIDLAILY